MTDHFLSLKIYHEPWLEWFSLNNVWNMLILGRDLWPNKAPLWNRRSLIVPFQRRWLLFSLKMFFDNRSRVRTRFEDSQAGGSKGHWHKIVPKGQFFSDIRPQKSKQQQKITVVRYAKVLKKNEVWGMLWYCSPFNLNF